MKKVISFSLYGNSMKYILGAIKNAIDAQVIYPGWTPRFYVSTETADTSMFALMQLEGMGAEIQLMPRVATYPPMFWRFLVADDVNVERFICRDCDSRLSKREAACVEEWIREDTVLSVIRDHPAHQCMPGGLWGATWRRDNWAAPKMQSLMDTFLKTCPRKDTSEYQTDQDFLVSMVWGWAKQSATIHDSSPGRRKEIGGKRFPTKRDPWPRFCGEVMDVGEHGEDIPRAGDWESVSKEE